MKIDDDIIKLLKQQKKVTIGMSMGKDSLACAAVLQELEIDFIPFYFYHIPDLEFVKEQIDIYENIFQREIIQFPHPMLYDNLRHQDFMTKEFADYLAGFHLPKMTFEDMIYLYCNENNEEENMYDIVGMRAAESFNRRKFFQKLNKGYCNKKKKIYPIYNWKKSDVLNYLQEKKIPLTNDYQIWDRSFDGLKYQFLFGVKKHYPNDYEKIKELFPLIDLELKRYEFNMEYFGK